MLGQPTCFEKLLTPVVLVFALSLLPLNILQVIPFISLQLLYFKHIYLVFDLSALLIVINASVDPLIYCLVCYNFRNAFKSLIRVHRLRYKTHMTRDTPSFQLESIPASERQRRMTNSTSLFSSKEQMNKGSLITSTHL